MSCGFLSLSLISLIGCLSAARGLPSSSVSSWDLGGPTTAPGRSPGSSSSEQKRGRRRFGRWRAVSLSL
eukprot:120267-Pyramimonas_sp.AAC.1